MAQWYNNKIKYYVDRGYTHEGGFQMMKWASSHASVLESVPEEIRAPHAVSKDVGNENSLSKVLGLHWNPTQDFFTFKLNFPRVSPEVIAGEKKPTKREVLSLIMSLFDPLGILSNFTIGLKILLQEIWRTGIGWDSVLSDQYFKKWKQWINHLSDVEQVCVPRCYSQLIPSARSLELHIFIDASESAYAAVAYLVIVSENKRQVAFVFGKFRVAPLKPVSIPRIKLLAAVIGVRIFTMIMEQLDMNISSIYFWTDSRDVLCWIRSDARKYKQFVANRIGEILEHSEVSSWKWVPSVENPADDATRPTQFDLKNSTRWLTGPKLISLPLAAWLLEPVPGQKTEQNLEMKQQHIMLTVEKRPLIDVTKFSSYNQLVIVATFILKFCSILKDRVRRKKGLTLCRGEQVTSLTARDLHEGEMLLIRESQSLSYAKEFGLIKKNRQLDSTSKILPLSPYVDEEGIMRSNTRICKAKVPRSVKYPVILDSRHPYTKLLVKAWHCKARHGSTELVLNEIRQQFYIGGLRSLLKKVAFECQSCE